ncbi:hypothetical protein GOBAR_AA12891 [Gossypium barbadense]|uniref:Uncharacterized protein n=1 Tax=Gossypium barbadense TaxID=3634 RepID=A0A2P5XWP3_GOSBA|nr:hypothetical protein GOBAR_AA12891 [Gossypium barbadense]
MVQPTLQKKSLKEVHELFSSSSRGPVHGHQRLQIEELDEWRTHKPRTHDKPELRQNELNTFPHQLKVGDKVLLDAIDPYIVTTTPTEEIPLTVLTICPIRYSRGQRFPQTGYDKLPWPWLELVAKPVKSTRAFDTPVPSNRGRTC